MPAAKKKLEDHLLAFLREHAPVRDRPGLLVAVSGGLDSTALLHLAVATCSRHKRPLAAGHFNHGVRVDADAEEERLRGACERLAVAFRSIRRREPATGRKPATDEATLRRLRYQALQRLARQADCGWILLAHQREDQAETVLLNLVRGTGIAGLSGMRPRRGRFLRPLLDVPRSTLRRYLEEIGERWVDDPTNRDLDRARNVVRHRLLPLIETELRPGATASLARTAHNLEKVRSLLEEQAQKCLAQCRLPAPPGEVRLDARSLATYHEGLIEHALRQAVRAVRGSTSDIPSSLWRGIVALHARGGDGRFMIPSSTSVEVTGRTVRISRIRCEDPAPSTVRLSWRGSADFLSGGRVRTRRLRARRGFSRLRIEAAGRTQVFDADALRPPFRMRSPRNGDRVAIGGDGTKKLADLLAERGVPRSIRGRQPVIEDASGILWVPGIRRADRALVDASTERLWVVRWIGRLPVETALVGGETRR